MPRASGEVVLVVEDEPAVREMTSRSLRDFGYRVIEAKNGLEALELLGGPDVAVRLMVADVVMPGMDGPELARQASTLRPDLQVLFMSGYTDDEVVRRGLLEAGQPFLQKPFTPEVLGAGRGPVETAADPARLSGTELRASGCGLTGRALEFARTGAVAQLVRARHSMPGRVRVPPLLS